MAFGKEPRELLTSPDAVAFGSAPTLWHVRLSPDGSKISFIQMHPEGVSVARVLTADSGVNSLMASRRNRFELSWCDWASNDRLLCGFRGIVGSTAARGLAPLTRLAAVNADGTGIKVLLQRELRDELAQFQDQIVDWMPDDPEHVLVELPETGGSGVSKLNIYTGRTRTETRVRRNAYAWLADGRGEPRVQLRITKTHRRWLVRQESGNKWEELRAWPLTDLSQSFLPVGFPESRNELLFFERVGGRRALFSQDLTTRAPPNLVYAHPQYDVHATIGLGKYNRLVAATYIDDRVRRHYFDERIGEIQARIQERFPSKGITIFDEDWTRRFYLLRVGSDLDAGTYYRFDAKQNQLAEIGPAHSRLTERALTPMRSIRYPAEDGVSIPAYLSVPERRPGERFPAVLLPHGGPSSRDYVGFNWLVQFLTARGFVVLQSDYRGSGGYGAAWEGEGAFKGWRRAIADIEAGAQYLIDQGIADPNRMCIVGWSYGGYAALMNMIEAPNRYQCGVSIAGVTDPASLGREMRRFVGGKSAQEFIGTSDEVLEHGSPLRRADEVVAPVLLIHAEKDVNVPVSHSRKLEKALRRSNKDVALVEYEHAEHSIRPERYRIDLLTRLGNFLEEHT